MNKNFWYVQLALHVNHPHVSSCSSVYQHNLQSCQKCKVFRSHPNPKVTICLWTRLPGDLYSHWSVREVRSKTESLSIFSCTSISPICLLASIYLSFLLNFLLKWHLKKGILDNITFLLKATNGFPSHLD